MVNIVYFYNTIRDDFSTTTEEEETPSTSNRYTHGNQPIELHGNTVSFPLTIPDDFSTHRYTHQQQGNDHILGGVGFWRVFKGWIDENKLTATKPEGGVLKYSNSKDDNNDAKDVASDEGGILEYSNSKEFTFNQLKSAIRKFHNDDILRGGGFGRLFKGWIDENKLTATNPGEGIPVAIKILNQRSFQGHHEWQADVNYLGRLYHPNLLRLLGDCLHNEERLLVYEFMPRGSLGNHLFKKVSTPLSWSDRMKIALGAAKGLAFLHSAPINVIHQAFHSSNILLDKDYNAKLFCFGFARDRVSSRAMGAYGYAAPEDMATGFLTAKFDVYMFGVVLLEMLSGRRVIDMDRPSEEHNLVDWAKPYLNDKHKVYRVADSRLEGQYSLKGFQKAANLALICVSQNGKSRPNMDEVVKVLGEL